MSWFLLGSFTYFLILLAERVLVSVSPYDAEQLSSNPSRSAQRAYGLTRDIRQAMAALLLARLFVKLLLIVFTAAWLVHAPAVRSFLYALSQQLGWSGSLVWFLFALLFAAAFAGLFWGIKKIDTQRATNGRTVSVLLLFSRFILFWKKLFSPFIKKEKTGETEPDAQTPTEAVAASATAATSQKRELELLKSIVKFGDVTVKQIMQPRNKVVGIDFRSGFHDVLATVREAEFSRLPVYQEDLDNVTGILYIKDLMPHLEKPDDFEWQPLIRTNVLLAPESKRGAELLQEFKQQKVHMAIVVDEYGGSAGIVTLEDILEEVTGDIRDEFDEESEVRYRKLDDYTYLFEGQTLLNDVCRITGLPDGRFDPARGTADTLAGLVLELKGDIPKTGAEIAWDGFLFTVTAADNRRIEQLKLALPRSDSQSS